MVGWVNIKFVRDVAELVSGLRKRRPGPQICDINGAPIAPRHGAAASSQTEERSDALAKRRFAALFTRELCRRCIILEPGWITIKKRITEPNVGVTGAALLGELAQRLERGHSRQHRDCVLARKPGDIFVLCNGRWERGFRGIGDEHVEWQLRKRP